MSIQAIDPNSQRVSGTFTAFTAADMETMKATVAKGCTDAEFNLLMRLATTYGLDPFAKEIWAIKRNANEAALIITSRDGYLKVAQRDPNYLGLQAAVVKEGDSFSFNPSEGTVTHSFGAKRGAILGAWAIAHHRGRMPAACYVEFSEYKGGSPIWSKFPSAMITKVAEVFVLKRQFGITGLVTREEMDADSPPDVARPANITLIAERTVENRTGEVLADTWAPSAAQLKRLYAIAKANGLGSKEELRGFMAGEEGFPEKEGQLTHTQYNVLCDELLPAYGAAAEPDEFTDSKPAAPDYGAAMVGATPLTQGVIDVDHENIP